MFTTFWWGTIMWGIAYLTLDLINYMIHLSFFGMFLLPSFLLNLSDQAKPRYIIYNRLSSVSYSWRSWDCWDMELFRKIRQEAVTVPKQVTWLSTPLSSPRFLRVCYFSRHSFSHFMCMGPGGTSFVIQLNMKPASDETTNRFCQGPCLCPFLCWLIYIFFQRN